MGKTKEKYVVDDYVFASRSEYDRALKEKETISYLIANTNMSDMKSVLKVYNRAVEKKSFQTVIGLEFVKNMRKRLIGSGFMSEETIEHVPVSGKIKGASQADSSTLSGDKSMLESSVERYKKACENAQSGLAMRNIIIGVLVVVIIAMMIITYKTKYSVFTYFTDYKAQMEEELIDKYEKWEKELEEKEKKLNSNKNIQDQNAEDSNSDSSK